MTNSKTKKNKIIYVIATLILAMIFVIISSDQVFAGGNCFRHATQFKLNVEHEGRTRDCGAGDFYRFKTSPVKASYKFILYSLDNMYISVSLYDNNFNEVDYFSTDNATTEVLNRLKKNTDYYLEISSIWGNDSYILENKEIITPPAKAAINNIKPGRKKVTVSWKSAARAKKYQVSIRKGKGKWKTYTTSSTKKTFKKLKSKKKYSVKVRGFFKYKNKNRYGKWSKVRTVKVN